MHCFFFLILGTGHSTARIASSNTVFKPFCVKAEHSRYFTAPTSLAIARPCIMLLCIMYNCTLILLSSSLSIDVKTKYLGIGDGSQPLFFQFIDGLLVFPEVELGTHQNYGHLRTVVPHLGVPLGPHILKTGGIHQGETDQEYVLQRI